MLDQLELVPRRLRSPQSPTSSSVAPGIAASTGEWVAHSTWPPRVDDVLERAIRPRVEENDSAASGSSRQ